MNPLPLSATIKRYLELKQALGRGYAIERQVLLSLNAFLVAQQFETLTADSFNQWCQTQQSITSGVRRNRMRIVRNFCLYRQRSEPESFVPDVHLFPLAHQPVRPYIFSDTDIACLLKTTATLLRNARSPLRSEVFRLAVVLLYTTGMRRGELIRLTLSDYDPQTRTLHVRESKFHKSRYLPLSPDGDQAINTYFAGRRARRLSMAPDTPLLWNGYGGGYTGSGFGRAMRHLFGLANIRTPEGRLPRTHDLRHYSGSRIIPSGLIGRADCGGPLARQVGIITSFSKILEPRHLGGNDWAVCLRDGVWPWPAL